jgi:hypothetical protein
MNRKFLFRGGEYAFRAADVNDVSELADMYGKVAVTTDNYLKKFDYDCQDNFEKTGGIFAPLSEDAIHAELSKSIFTVITSDSGEISAMLWFSHTNPAFAGKGYENDRLHIFACDIIVRPGSVKGLSRLMYYAGFSHLYECGFRYSLGEVYRILGYTDQNGAHDCDLTNFRSFNSIMKTGARHIGQNPVHNIPLLNSGTDADVSAAVLPLIVRFDYDTVLPILENTVIDRRGL